MRQHSDQPCDQRLGPLVISPAVLPLGRAGLGTCGPRVGGQGGRARAPGRRFLPPTIIESCGCCRPSQREHLRPRAGVGGVSALGRGGGDGGEPVQVARAACVAERGEAAEAMRRRGVEAR